MFVVQVSFYLKLRVFQVEKTTAVADEAVGNIRTVRAFAMEDQEEDMFTFEAEEAMVLNQKLGLGIALFQAGTNMFLNRYFYIWLLPFGCSSYYRTNGIVDN